MLRSLRTANPWRQMEGTMQKTTLAAMAALIIGSTFSASAADLVGKAKPYIPRHFDYGAYDVSDFYDTRTWTGLYVGLNAGYGWGGTLAQRFTFGATSTETQLGSASGAIVGGQVGFKWQFAPNWLVGLETDFQWASLKASETTRPCAPCLPPFTLTVDSKMEWLGTTAVQLGYVHNRLFIGALGGAAYGKVNRTETYADPFFTSSFTTENYGVGYTLGAVVEYKLLRSLSAKVQYNYVDLSLPGSSSSFGFASSSGYTAHLVRGGLNYHF